MRYGMLTVLGTAPKYCLKCLCDCGVICYPTKANVKAGRSRSCGCRQREMTLAGECNLRHGHSKGRSDSIHNIWVQIRQRCENPTNAAYDRYGGRGISVCARWQVFENFLADMGERPPGRSIDRINNDGDYEPGNCRWATPKEQAANRRPKRWLKRPTDSAEVRA